MKNLFNKDKLKEDIINTLNNICITGISNIYNKLENQAKINYEKAKILYIICKENEIEIPKKIKDNINEFIKHFE